MAKKKQKQLYFYIPPIRVDLFREYEQKQRKRKRRK